ncbi:MBL fold metallo-hydrolase [Oceaniglobus ichthyenteri]|uniref:MBL fold metallo-hydrolase n=1 Tax=Oceaniglobus ichthyenteri TaxID=2136177 RepID=UPI000D362C89|nr:MBL fold metallo-hydrolase [Oceaniglobus ichthyenteri]
MRFPSPSLTRRSALLGAAALPAAAALPGLVRAAGHSAAAPAPVHHAFSIGDFNVSTLLAGTRTVEDPQGTFGMNVSAEEFGEVSRANFIPTDASQFFFTPTVVNTGGEVVLFDTGLNAAGITAALSAAGYAPDDITVVVITHMHGDHIGGLIEGDTPTFPNARYVTGQVEYDHWSNADNDGFKAKVAPLADKMTFIADGDAPVSGITAIAAFGHTPGHMTYHLESGEERLLLMADTANHYVWSLAHPEWEVRFDMDKSAAAQSRKKILGMVAAERIPLVGYHMPFPGVGYVDTRGEGGFAYVPLSYQMMLKG